MLSHQWMKLWLCRGNSLFLESGKIITTNFWLFHSDVPPVSTEASQSDIFTHKKANYILYSCLFVQLTQVHVQALHPLQNGSIKRIVDNIQIRQMISTSTKCPNQINQDGKQSPENEVPVTIISNPSQITAETGKMRVFQETSEPKVTSHNSSTHKHQVYLSHSHLWHHETREHDLPFMQQSNYTPLCSDYSIPVPVSTSSNSVIFKILLTGLFTKWMSL